MAIDVVLLINDWLYPTKKVIILNNDSSLTFSVNFLGT